MGNMTNEQLETKKKSLAKKAAQAKTMKELNLILEQIALVREEFKVRGLIFIKAR